MIVCKKNFCYTKKLQKQVYNKGVKSRSYVFNNKIWLNIKYIKMKQNPKFKAKFLELFQIFHPIAKQAYKLKLPKK